MKTAVIQFLPNFWISQSKGLLLEVKDDANILFYGSQENVIIAIFFLGKRLEIFQKITPATACLRIYHDLCVAYYFCICSKKLVLVIM